MKRRDKTEVLRDRLQLEDTRLLFQIDEAAEVIEKLSAGKIYSPCPATKLLAVVFHCYVDVVLRDAKRFYVPDADKQRKKFDKIISHETHLL